MCPCAGVGGRGNLGACVVLGSCVCSRVKEGARRFALCGVGATTGAMPQGGGAGSCLKTCFKLSLQKVDV
jgi:hypothetical protein